MDQVVEVKGIKLLATKVEDVDMNGLRDLGDQAEEKTRRRHHRDRVSNRRKSKPDGYSLLREPSTREPMQETLLRQLPAL